MIQFQLFPLLSNLIWLDRHEIVMLGSLEKPYSFGGGGGEQFKSKTGQLNVPRRSY